MQRCPACNARLGAATLCPRCGADLSRVILSDRLAEQWLSVALQSLHAGRADVAVPAICRSLSFKRVPAAKLVKGFLIQHQYQALYQSLGQRSWREADDTVNRLRILQGENETLRRFDELIQYLSVLSGKAS